MTSTDNYLVLGKTLFSIPLIGYVVEFAKTQTGLVLLIIIPAIIIMSLLIIFVY